MRAFLTLSVGARPQEARPLFSSDDPRLIRAVMKALFSSIGVGALLEATGDSGEGRGDPDEEEANDDRAS